MNEQTSPPSATNRPFQRAVLGGLDAHVAAKVVAASGDVAMVIDRDGVICDLALSNDDMERDGVSSWLDRRWLDTVTGDSKHKVEEMLRDALNDEPTRWRELNHFSPYGDPFIVRYLAVDSGVEGRVIAIGRDDRATARMQQRLLQAQQAMERDYSRLRDAESRYRLLFQMSGEAVLIVDAATKKIVEANPAAERFVSVGKGALSGQSFVKLFDAESWDAAASLLAVVQSTSRGNGSQATLGCNGREVSASGSLFRQDRMSLFLVRLSTQQMADQPATDPNAYLLEVLERLPDAFVVTDNALRIIASNAAFLDLVRIGSKEQAQGLALDRFLGRPNVDRNILLDTLRTHGSVRNFSTVLRNDYEEQEEIEVSAVSVPDLDEPCFGFTIRSVGRRLYDRKHGSTSLSRSVEELTELVGRVALKDLVRETTDLVERLCIEAALELTGNNRASAAEVLGLSRQSLYSKLHRFGLGNLTTDDD